MIQEICLSFEVEPAAAKILKAGELTCLYELGKLRYIRRGNTELLRMIYAAVRNEHWATLPYTIEDEKIETGDGKFSIQYTAVYMQSAAVYKAHFTIEGKSDSSISFSMKGEALAEFKRNRIGICVLHPIKTCSGQSVNITSPDGLIYQSVFPVEVSPHQPLLEIQQMQWKTSDNTSVQLFFEGDFFETEDQRNWSDSSYKTYSTPLRIPIPVTMQVGDTMQQHVKLTAFNNGNHVQPVENIRKEKISFPPLGYSRTAGWKLGADEAALLQKIPFQHYRVKLIMDDPDWQEELNNICAEAVQLNVQLELVVFFSDQFKKELDELISVLKEKQTLVKSILVLQKDNAVTADSVLTYAYPVIKNVLPAAMVGYGTDSNFAGLNRRRPSVTTFDFVSYGVFPQAHMTDNRSILENLDNLPDMIVTAQSIAAGKPVFVSPVTLNDRFNLSGADKRQFTAMAAWWTLMCIQQLSMAGSISFYELFGEAGLMKRTEDKTRIETSPVYKMLAIIHAFQPVWIVKRYAGDDLLLDGLLLEDANGKRLFFKPPEQFLTFRHQ